MVYSAVSDNSQSFITAAALLSKLKIVLAKKITNKTLFIIFNIILKTRGTVD
jgi:hypothetical protein